MIVDAKTIQAHQAQVMLYIMLLHLTGDRYREMRMSGRVYYGEDHTVNVPAGDISLCPPRQAWFRSPRLRS